MFPCNVRTVCVLSFRFFCFCVSSCVFFFFQAEDGIRDLVRSRGLGDVYKRQGVGDAVSDLQAVYPGVVINGADDMSGPSFFIEQGLSLIHI